MIDLLSTDVCGVKINNICFSNFLDVLVDAIEQNRCGYVVTPNVDHIVKLQSDPEFKEVYKNALAVIPDGMPLLWAARFFGAPLKEKISGSDIFPMVCEVAVRKKWRIFLLGGREGAAEKSADVLSKKYSGFQVVGTYCPPFGFELNPIENQKIVEMIKEAKPDILFVGLGSPKQEKWIYKYKDQYHVPVSIGIGASFEFVSGMVKRAPKWMQNVGLEWFWRLIVEPRRLWKRYLIDDPVFFWLVFKQKMGWLKGE